jgi:hypothetical protein
MKIVGPAPEAALKGEPPLHLPLRKQCRVILSKANNHPLIRQGLNFSRKHHVVRNRKQSGPEVSAALWVQACVQSDGSGRHCPCRNRWFWTGSYWKDSFNHIGEPRSVSLYFATTRCKTQPGISGFVTRITHTSKANGRGIQIVCADLQTIHARLGRAFATKLGLLLL